MAIYNEKYPYFIVPTVEALKSGELDEEQAEEARRFVAANVGDIPSLRLMLGLDPEEFAEFYPDLLPQTPSTADTIDSFLSYFGNSDAPTPRAAAEIPEEEAPDETASAIDSFLSSVPSPALPKNVRELEKAAEEIPAEVPEKAPATENLARELIKKHEYQGALQIIQQLLLVNPEKSVYFADQIRFLKKLIVNEARKNNLKR